MRDPLGHFGHPVILYDGHPYSLPEEMQYRPSSTSFDDLWRFGKMGREGELEAQQEDLMDIIDRLAQGMEGEREIEKLRCELNEKVHVRICLLLPQPLLIDSQSHHEQSPQHPSATHHFSPTRPQRDTSHELPRQHSLNHKASLPPLRNPYTVPNTVYPHHAPPSRRRPPTRH